MPIQQQGQQHISTRQKRTQKSYIVFFFKKTTTSSFKLVVGELLLGNFYRYNKQQEMCLGFTLICYSNTSRHTKDDYSMSGYYLLLLSFLKLNSLLCNPRSYFSLKFLFVLIQHTHCVCGCFPNAKFFTDVSSQMFKGSRPIH